ncbi:MAG: TIGR01212 family radical SAM protein [Lachnospiraceae bacterium]|nr:TIGR01212 family radical SAM protein [Lachnospiraceae bacterium]
MILLNDHLKKEYGCKVYKLSLQIDVTCPVRDGSIDTRGCIFCSEGGSGEFASCRSQSISDQISEAKERVAAKAGDDAKYIAYFQSFTNTYGDISYLEKKYREAMEPDDIVAISIGTRPDCISDEMYELLGKLNRIKPVWIELGLQTIHSETAKYIRRGYELSVYDECVRRLREKDITVIVHVILGLPGETTGDMRETVRYVCSSGVQGIKLQLLHVLKGTDLYEDYLNGKVPVMTMEEYLDLLKELLPLIPDDVIIHRLTGDGPKRLLVAPLWTADKKKVINAISKITADL